MRPQFKRRLLKYRVYVLPTILVGLFFISVFFLIYFVIPLYKFASQNNLTPGFFLSLISGKEVPIKKYHEKTNLVILGMASGQHEGADLTDTIIFLSVDFTKPEVVMASLPRDIWLPSIKDKINSSYHYGEEKKKGGGLPMAKAVIEEVVGQPVHYAILVDFSGFRKMIDLVGGVDIFVEKAFTDNQYPLEGKEEDFCGGDPTFACRYEQLHFDKGVQRMDGEKALKYVRSRMAEGEEGSDFAREKRQQQVIVAFKNKLLESSILRSPTKAKQLFFAVNEVINTDMNWSEKLLLFKFFLTLPNNKMRRLVLDNFFINPSVWEYNGAWVLVPRTEDFGEVQKYISCQLENPNCPIQP